MDISINNITDLKAEIARLKIVKEEQGVALQARFSGPSAIFHSVLSLFPKSPEGSKGSGFFDQDIFGLLSRILLPLTLNKTLFRNSNFIVKTLVGYLSQKASHFVNEDAVTSIWDKAKLLIEKFTKKKEADHRVPFGSEAI